MSPRSAVFGVAILLALNGCSTTSSSNAVGPVGSTWEGPILVTQATIPAGIAYKVVGSVQADARVGYDSAASLYPLLAAEARKIGANAVVNATGGRRVTAFSWSAAYVNGIAVRVEDPQMIKGLSGSYHSCVPPQQERRFLMPEEVDVWSGSPSQILNAGIFAVCGLLSLTLFLAVLAIPYALWRWLVLKNTRYELTSQRLKTHSGVLSKRVEEIELYRVKDTRFDQPFLQRLFGLGNVLILSHDSTTPVILIQGVHGAKELREKLRVLVETRRDQKRVRVGEFT